MVKKIFISTMLLLFVTSFSFSQSILTAADFFDSVSANFGSVQTYEADLDIRMGSSSNLMRSRVSFKQPNLLRIDFSSPATQTIVFNGNQLTVFLPNSNVILTQTVQGQGGAAGGMNLATPEGLTLMKRYYSISYETGQDAVPLDESGEMVVKLVLTRRNTTEGFRTIRLAINPETLLIRRVEAVSVTGIAYTFDFYNYSINQNIPDMRFIYDLPPTSNTYNDFLFADTE